MTTWRSQATIDRYEAYKQSGGLVQYCNLCELEKSNLEPRHIFEHWFICKNNFPYDVVADRHDMLITKRHITEDELNEAERAELGELKKGMINDTYDYIIEPTYRTKSIPPHLHYHLVTEKQTIGA